MVKLAKETYKNKMWQELLIIFLFILIMKQNTAG